MVSFVVEDGSGIAAATSYVSIAEADDLSEQNIHTHAAWMALTLDEKQRLLVYTSRALDARANWNGERTTTAQGLAWPRLNVVDRYGNAVSASSVPRDVRWAVVEIAKANISEDRLSLQRADSVVSEIKVDSITLKFADAANTTAETFAFPEIALDLLRGFGTFRNNSKKFAHGRLSVNRA